MTPAQEEYVRAIVKNEVAKAYRKICAEVADLRGQLDELRAKMKMIPGEPPPLWPAVASPTSLN
jgi:hypothetical protein